MRDIETRKDINSFLQTFYGSVREGNLIGSIINKHIQDWEEHYAVLTNFWNMHLFQERNYKGNPIQLHRDFDKKAHYKITIDHFGAWINIWIKTINTLFKRENATILKMKARKMGTNLNLQVFLAKPQL